MKIRCAIFVFALVALASPASAYTRAPVAAENGMVVTSQHLASAGRRRYPEGRRQCRRCRGGGRLCARRYQSVLRQSRRRRLCDHPSGRRPGHLRQFPREGAAPRRPRPCISTARARSSKDLSLKGYRAVAVPGTVLGLDTVLAKYGTMQRAQGDGAGDQAGRRRLRAHPGRRRRSWPARRRSVRRAKRMSRRYS